MKEGRSKNQWYLMGSPRKWSKLKCFFGWHDWIGTVKWIKNCSYPKSTGKYCVSCHKFIKL